MIKSFFSNHWLVFYVATSLFVTEEVFLDILGNDSLDSGYLFFQNTIVQLPISFPLSWINSIVKALPNFSDGAFFAKTVND